MRTIGARIVRLERGAASLEISQDDSLTEPHGCLQAGVTAALVENACTYAAYSLAPADRTPLTVELKFNLTAPAEGSRFVAEAEVLRHGRTTCVCSGSVTASAGNKRSVVAQIVATIALVDNRDRRDRAPRKSGKLRPAPRDAFSLPKPRWPGGGPAGHEEASDPRVRWASYLPPDAR